MPDELLQRLRRFHDDTFPGVRDRFETLVKDGQRPTILFIGCSDSRLVPYLLTGTGPGELFIVRNVAAFVPPYDGSAGYHGTSAAIEFAVLNLQVARIVVCGHSHCGGIRALYDGAPACRRPLVIPGSCCAVAVAASVVSSDVRNGERMRAVQRSAESGKMHGPP